MKNRYRNAVKCFQEKDYKSALRIAQQALTTAEGAEKVNFLNLLGIIYHELGLYKQAVNAFNFSLEINRKNFMTWENLAIVYRKLNEFRKAENCYKEALRLNPESEEILTSLGILYLYIDETEKAINVFEKSLEINADWGLTYGNLALAYALNNNFEKADRTLEKAAFTGYSEHREVKERITHLKQYHQHYTTPEYKSADAQGIILN